MTTKSFKQQGEATSHNFPESPAGGLKAAFKGFMCAGMAILFAALVFASCEKDDPAVEMKEDVPGEIAGLGETAGELTGTPFQLPQGIELADKIRGGYSSYNYNRSAAAGMDKAAVVKSLKALPRSAGLRADGETIRLDTTLGSGYYVEIFMPLRNTTSAPISVTFPAGLIAKSVSGECQNGVLLKKASIRVPAKSVYGVLLMMYCGNAHRSASYSSEEYVFAVVSNSSLIMDLCNRLKNKRINYEEYPANRSQYNSYVSILQSILWDLTDYAEALSEEQIAEIEAMENV